MIINQAHLRNYILAQCAARRPGHKFDRVAASALRIADAHLRRWVQQQVDRLPSVGKTVKFTD